MMSSNDSICRWLDLIDNNFIRFIVPTTIAPQYSPSLDPLKSSDRRRAEIFIPTTKPYSNVTELFQSLEYLKDHLPSKVRSRQIFLSMDPRLFNPYKIRDLSDLNNTFSKTLK
jgi:hypothetical protein